MRSKNLENSVASCPAYTWRLGMEVVLKWYKVGNVITCDLMWIDNWLQCAVVVQPWRWLVPESQGDGPPSPSACTGREGGREGGRYLCGGVQLTQMVVVLQVLKDTWKWRLTSGLFINNLYHGSVLLYVTVPLLHSESTVSSLTIKLRESISNCKYVLTEANELPNSDQKFPVGSSKTYQVVQVLMMWGSF